MKRPVQRLIPFEINNYVKEDSENVPNLIANCPKRKAAVTAGGEGGEGRGGACPFPPTFLQSKKKKGKQREKRKSFKAEIIKRLSLRSNVTVLAILERLEFKTFSCGPTMVAENIFQCSVAP